MGKKPPWWTISFGISARGLYLVYTWTVECLALLAADLRVDLDTTDKEGRRLEEVARWQGWETCSCCRYQILRYSGRQVIEEAKQRREEKKRQGI